MTFPGTVQLFSSIPFAFGKMPEGGVVVVVASREIMGTTKERGEVLLAATLSLLGLRGTVSPSPSATFSDSAVSFLAL